MSDQNHWSSIDFSLVDVIKDQIRKKEYDKAEENLLHAIDKFEAIALKEKEIVPPWWYYELAVLYHKKGDLNKEKIILERYINLSGEKNLPLRGKKILERLQKLKV